MPQESTAVVLGGGGLAGIGWTIGALAALEESGVLRFGLRRGGSRTVFTSGSGVGLVDALTASCAVPGLWPVVRIDDADYIDGGTFSLTNAELAHDADHVIVLQPMPELPVYATAERQEVFDRAVVIEPSERAHAGFGSDPFDPDV